MLVLSKLNSIKICEIGVEDAKSTFSYGLYCSCCKSFIIDFEGFSDSITKLLGLLHTAVLTCTMGRTARSQRKT